MDEQVKQALENLKTEPCRPYALKLADAVNAANESDRRMAIDDLEHYLYKSAHPAHYATLSAALAELRRAQ